MSTTYIDLFASRLRSLREERGLTVYALAQKAGITRQFIGRLESEQLRPSWDTVVTLADALEVSTEAFRTAVPAAKKEQKKS